MTRRPAAPRQRPLALPLLPSLAALALGVLLLPGCFLGQPYQDFRAYYNTFYNAERAYENGLEQITREDEPVDRNQYLAIFAAPERGRGSNVEAFDDAVEKAAAVLRDRPDTRFADDALLLIGKSYFYQENVVGAERKFNEAMEVALEREDEDRADEARFWLGRTLAAAEQYDAAADGLRLAVQREGVAREWRAQMELALGDLLVRAGRFEEAVEALETGLEQVRKDDTSARAQFLLGQVYETLERYDEAAEAYGAVGDYKPLYELDYAAQLSRALVLGLGAGRADESLGLLQRMRRDDKNFDKLAEVEVARARVLLASGQPAAARDLLRDQLYDRTRPASGPARTQAYYRLAEVYREGFDDYVRAATYLDTAVTSFRPLPRDVRLTPDALRDVNREADSYGAFAAVARRVAEYDSLLYLGSLDDDAYALAIDRIRDDRIAERRREEAEQRRLETESGFGRSVGGIRRGQDGFGDQTASVGGVQGAGASQGTVDSGLGSQGGQAEGFLGYRNPSRVQQSLVNFRLVWGDRPLAPNWRRAEAVGALANSGDGAVVNEVGGATGRDAYDIVVDDSAVPRTENARAALRAERAAARYELGNRLFLQLGRADSAATWFTTVLAEDPGSEVTLRARYALAEIRREQGQEAEAEALYRRLLNEADPSSNLSLQVRERLGLAPAPASADTAELASAAYAAATRTWRDGRYVDAMADLFGVEAAFPRTDAAPRALLAAGIVYTEWAQRDTLDAVGLFDPLPVRRRSAPDSVVFDLDALYDGLEADYRGTPFAERAADLQAALDPFRPVPDTASTADSTGNVPVAALDPAAADSLDGSPAFPSDSLAAAEDVAVEEDLDDDRSAFEEQADQAVAAAVAGMPTPAEAGPPGDQILDEEPEAVADRFEEGDLIGPEPLDASLGGFSWQVAVSESRGDIADIREWDYASEGFRTAVYAVNLESGPGFALLVGQFNTAAEARAARSAVLAQGGTDLTLVAIGDLQLLDEDDED